ncbi:hypothetical protein DAPPUDRAFT_211709 [Daphnia pulex]|uniref:Phospholipid scramblase n=1 Tax=Daphnia pulex TaxID=6669 RepID=E9GIA0_DAPPU|nr:hypothetical protein DAPPUDRAFT_211709 [Daphnia pulex]|eukprot:EFX80807.1 hypothetical protein DAPPUDRAFT_211709 [Daphnia pulex]
MSHDQQYPVVNQPQAYGAYGAPTSPSPQQHLMGPPQHVGGDQQWMPKPNGGNCPPGLEYLTQVDQILVHQMVEILEMFTGFETNNKYVVKNSVGQKIFFAAEDSGCCERYWCNNLRSFEMNILDNFGNEVIHIHRPLACQSCLYPCCLQKMEVSAPPGNVIGTIEQEWSIFPRFKVKDVSGNVVLKIEGPFFPCSCCGTDVNFEIFSSDGEQKVGKISKQWAGILREMVTDADVFGINFPMDLDVKMKAVLLSACFLIDFMYFEDKQNSRNQN